MRTPALLALLVATATTVACGGSGSSTPGAAPPPQRVATERIVTADGAMMQMNTMNIDTDVRLFSTGTVDEVWSVLPAVYAELGIPLSLNEPANKTLGNLGWRTRRQIARVPMQRYLDCGSSGTIANAETYNITMTITTTAKPNPAGGSVVSTALTATGRNPVTSSTSDVRCASTGDLEIRIRDMVQKKVMEKM